MNETPYKLIDHTADIGIEVAANSMEDLFRNAAYGFLDILTDAKQVNPQEIEWIHLTAGNYDELLIRWLAELLYRYDTEQKLFSRCEFIELDEKHLKVKVNGELFDPLRHFIKHEIKAVTYHGVHIQKQDHSFHVKVIFDI